MNIKEAAKYLAISVKTLERKIASGELSVAYTPGATGKQRTFDQAELDRFKEVEAAKVAATTYVARPRGVVPVASDAPQGTLVRTTNNRALERRVEQSLRQQRLLPLDTISDLAAKLMLSREDAARLSGLPLTMIREAIAEGALKAIKTGAGWRVKRVDLETYVEEL